MALFTLVQSASTSTITSGTTMSVTLASAVGAGHLLVATMQIFGGSNTPTVTTVHDSSSNSDGHGGNSGNYFLPAGGKVTNSNNQTLSAVYYAFASAAVGAGTLTITMTGTNVSAFCQFSVGEYSCTSGSFTTDPIDTANTSTQNNGGASATPSVTLTTSGANRLVVGGAIGDGGQTAAGNIAGSAATLISNTSGNGDVCEWGISAASTSVVCTTGPNDTGWDMAFAAFKAPSASSSPILRTQVRAPGYPLGAPVPGIARLGAGILLAPSTATQQTISASISESITGPSDVVLRNFTGSRAVAESVTDPSDAAARQTAAARAVAESVTGPSDSPARATVDARAVAESVTGPSDAAARTVAATRAIAESVTGPSDAMTRQAGLVRLVAESVTGPSDAVARAFTGARSVAEAVTGPSDSAARSTVASRAEAESIATPTDSVATARGEARSTSESITGPSDAVARAFAGARAEAESIAGPTDAVARSSAESRAVSESVNGPSDSPARATTASRSVAESIPGPTDSAARTTTESRAVAESVTGPSDAPARQLAATRAIAETIPTPPPTDSVAQGAGNIQESVATPTDALAHAVVAARSLAESVAGPSDAVARSHGDVRAASETVTAPSDAVARATSAGRPVAESIADPLDAVQRGGDAVSRQLAEAVATPADSVSQGTPPPPPTGMFTGAQGGPPPVESLRGRRRRRWKRAAELEPGVEASRGDGDAPPEVPTPPVATPSPQAPAYVPPRAAPLAPYAPAHAFGAVAAPELAATRQLGAWMARTATGASAGTPAIQRPLGGTVRGGGQANTALGTFGRSVTLSPAPVHGAGASRAPTIARAVALEGVEVLAGGDAGNPALEVGHRDFKPENVELTRLRAVADELRANLRRQTADAERRVAEAAADAERRVARAQAEAGALVSRVAARLADRRDAPARAWAAPPKPARPKRKPLTKSQVVQYRNALLPSGAAERQYKAKLRGIMAGVHEGIRQVLEREVWPELARRADADIPADRARRVLTPRLREKVARHISGKVGPAFDLMQKSVDRDNGKAMSLIGIPLDEAAHLVAQKVARARAANIALMEDAGRDYVDDVREVITDPKNLGLRVEDLADLVEKAANVPSRARAELIAVDQTLKLAAALTQARQTAAGVTTYRWSTSRDERVRPMHADLEGETFDWDDPPVTNDDGDTNHPGEDYRCRCVAIPIVGDDESDDA